MRSEEEWDLSYSDGGGPEDYGDYEEGTACNPTGLIDGEYEQCQNEGTISDPNWQCAGVGQATQEPPAPQFSMDECGDVDWDLYDEVDVGRGGESNGACQTSGCTTTDSFSQFIVGEVYGGQAVDCSF